MTYGELLQFGRAELENAKIEDSDFDARELLLGISGLSRTALLMGPDVQAPEEVVAAYQDCIARRCTHYPLQYLLGEWDFYGLTFHVGPGVLIPRPETELLVTAVLEYLETCGEKHPEVLDLCAGSGCIGLSVAVNFPNSHVTALEKSDKAFPYLSKNAEALGVADRYTPVPGDLFDGPAQLPAGYRPNVIVSNPPYISEGELPGLREEVHFEHVMALNGGGDGLVFYRAITDSWLVLLPTGGMLALECAENQTQKILCSLQGRVQTARSYVDYAGLPRGVTAIR